MVTPISTRLCFVEGSLRSQIMSSKYDTRLYKPDEQERPSIFSHCVPWNPGAQLQLYPLTPSVQVALFLQGWLSQVTFWEYKITSIIFVNTILLIVQSNVNVKKEYREIVDPYMKGVGPIWLRRRAVIFPLCHVQNALWLVIFQQMSNLDLLIC